MSLLVARKRKSIFTDIYDKHSPKLYGITLKISRNINEAEDILIKSFKEFYKQRTIPKNDDHVFILLLRITISIASKKMNLPKRNIGKMILTELNHVSKCC